MNRIGVGIVSALVALSPMAAGAQPAPAAGGPKVLPVAGPAADFKFYAGSNFDDVARTTNVPELLTRIGLRDPAAEISIAVAKDLAKRKGGSLVESYPADYTVTVTSTDWSAGYYVPFRPTYNLRYVAELSVTDKSGAVVKTGTCQVNPDDANSAGGNDMLIAHGGRKLKEIYAKATDSCVRTFITKTKGL
jgi:hypothetical protein